MTTINTTATFDLTSRAMLVTLTIKQWSAAKHDRKISAEVAQNHNSAEHMGRFNKQLLPPKALDKVKRIAGAWRTEHYRLTLPWLDNGDRILSSAGYLDYCNMTAKFEAEFQAAVEEAAAEYPAHRQEAQRLLNGLFDASEYPTVEQFRKKFAGGANYLPMPDASDFRVQLSSAATAVLKQSIQDTVNAALEAAMSDVWSRIKEVVSAMAAKLRAYKVTADGVEGIFRDSLVENVRDLVSILPSLNITNNPDIKAFTQLMQEELCAYDAGTLRASEQARNKTAAAAEAILDQMSEFI